MAMKLTESRRAFRRSLKNGWNIYKRSKTGIAGLAIIIGFLILAIGAPLFTPYTTSFTAPSIDIIRGDIFNQTLPYNSFAAVPAGVIIGGGLGGGAHLSDVFLMDTNGTAYSYPITFTYVNKILKVGLNTPVTFQIPLDVKTIKPETSYIYSSSNPTTFVGYSANKVYFWDHSFNNMKEVSLNYTIDYTSVFYNTNPTGSVTYGQYILYVVASGSNATLILFNNYVPPFGGLLHSFYVLNIHLPSNIIAKPLISFNTLNLNDSMLIFPTQTETVAYKLNMTQNVFGGLATLNLGSKLWAFNYTVAGQTYTPISIIFPYPYGDSTYGKNVINVATSNNQVLGYRANNGTFMYEKPFFIKSSTMSGYQLVGLYPGGQGPLLADALWQGSSIVASVDYNNGMVINNFTAYQLLIGKMIGTPSYILSENHYLLSTSLGKVYLLNPANMTPYQMFTILGGGLKTPVAFLGNVLEANSVIGNYIGAVSVNPKGNEQIYLQETTGTNVAPLPPGTYKSGNTYILGTDAYGHDIWTWLIYGARQELMLGTVAALSSVLLGTFIGLVSGFYGGWIDAVLMRIVDIFLSLPALVIMLLLVSILGPSLWNIIFVIIILSWAGVTRIIRAQVLSLKSRAFIDSARVSGASNTRLMLNHLFPNVVPLTFLFMAFGVSGAILTEAALAFLGFGDPHSVTWGMMLQYLQLTGHVLDAPWWLLPPGIAITLLSLAFYLVGRAFDEVVNPRLRRR